MDFDKELENQAEYVIQSIVNRRHSLMLTQKEMEEITGIKQPAIARFENKKIHAVRLDTLLKYLLALGLRIEIKENDRYNKT